MVMENKELIIYSKQLSKFCHDHANVTCSLGGYIASLVIKTEKGELTPEYLIETLKNMQTVIKVGDSLVDNLYKELHTVKIEEGW